MTFTKKDFKFSLITGLTTGVISWQIFNFLNVPLFRDISFAWLILIIPVLWILGVNLGYFLGKWFNFFNQFGKFSVIGFTNAAVDFGVLNLLIATTALAAGIWFSVFKGVSFIVAVLHSYFWNKYWAFRAGESHGGSTEFFKFASVAAMALLVNVGVASFIVNFVNPVLGANPQVWANIGAVAGAASALIISFAGFKFLVFKK